MGEDSQETDLSLRQKGSGWGQEVLKARTQTIPVLGESTSNSRNLFIGLKTEENKDSENVSPNKEAGVRVRGYQSQYPPKKLIFYQKVISSV